jgi:hypothetical protein
MGERGKWGGWSEASQVQREAGEEEEPLPMVVEYVGKSGRSKTMALPT